MSNYKTEQEALLSCLRVWQTMKHFNCNKREAYYKLQIPQDLYSCPCCEFTSKDGLGPVDCSKCPLWDCEERDPGDQEFRCEVDPRSPYLKWQDPDPETSYEGALEMIEAIQRCLETGEKL